MATSAEKLRQYEDLFEKSQAYNPAQFQSDFERAYGETTGYNKDLIQQQSQALGNLQSVAPELRQRYSQTLIKDPTLQRSLIAQARQAPIADYSTAVNLLGQRGQRYADILGKSLSGYQTSAQQAQTAAENAWRLYQDQLAQEEAAKARAAAAANANRQNEIMEAIEAAREKARIDALRRNNAEWNRKANEAWNTTYEIPEGVYGSASLGDSFQDRLVGRVLDQQGTNNFGDTLMAYSKTSQEPFRNIRSVGDAASIIPRQGAAAGTIIGDLFDRIFKR